jgi:cell wall-associated NlpC family hydrolase
MSGFEKIGAKDGFKREDIVAYAFKSANATGHSGIMINSKQFIYASPKNGLRVGYISKWGGNPTWYGNRYNGLLFIFYFTSNIIEFCYEKN